MTTSTPVLPKPSDSRSSDGRSRSSSGNDVVSGRGEEQGAAKDLSATIFKFAVGARVEYALPSAEVGAGCADWALGDI